MWSLIVPPWSVPDYCETHHEEAYLTNVTAVSQLAVFCEEYKSRFIHLSTDFVFDGKMFVFDEKINENAGLLYTEEDIPAPVNYYGYTKWKGEEKVAETCSSFAIVRVAIVYGRALPGQHGNIVQLVMNRLKAGQEIRVVSDSMADTDLCWRRIGWCTAFDSTSNERYLSHLWR